MIDDALFITGMQRSGTTLLEKLIGAQPVHSLLSQPFPLLYVEAKRAFLATLAIDDPYPLGHHYRESRYTLEQFDQFLRGWRTSTAALTQLFERMTSYSGQYTRFDADRLSDAFRQVRDGDDFAQVVHRLDHALPSKTDARWFGSKETFCEEYVPYLLHRGFRCAIIIRDPRDVLASLNHGRGQEFGGAVKPTLFNLRNWRKSVAFALAMEGHPRFTSCRYEDLVADPRTELDRIAQALDIESITGHLSDEIRDANGERWLGNSSHGERHGVERSSAGIHRAVLPEDVARAAEAACLPELRRLGYESTMTSSEAITVLTEFRDPYPLVRSDMAADATSAENTHSEIERLERIGEEPGDESRHWFLFKRAHAELRAAFLP